VRECRSAGVRECRSAGVRECWGEGVQECWCEIIRNISEEKCDVILRLHFIAVLRY